MAAMPWRANHTDRGIVGTCATKGHTRSLYPSQRRPGDAARRQKTAGDHPDAMTNLASRFGIDMKPRASGPPASEPGGWTKWGHCGPMGKR
jgi:hypothetical protein